MFALAKITRAALASVLLAGVGVVGATAVTAGAASASLRTHDTCYPLGNQNCGGRISSPHNVTRGSVINVSVSGYAANTPVTIKICDIKTVTVTTDSNGQASTSATVPTSHHLGACKITSSGRGDNTTLTLTTTTAIRATPHSTIGASNGTLTSGHESSETFTVKVVGSNPTPTGTVKVFANGKRICSGALSGGVYKCHPANSALGTGGYKVKATYSGNAYWYGTASNTVSVTVKKSSHHRRHHKR